MSQDNLTAVLYKTKDLRLEQTPIPEIDDDEVLLRMDCVGICGSDVHYWQTGACGAFVMHEPMIMGHEASGVVAKIGSKVKNLAVGDRVAIEPGVPCRYCEFCKTGRYHLCPDMRFCATPPIHGNLARYYKHAADFCYKLPPHVTMEEGALLEPLSVGIHACRRGGVQAGQSVLVLGAGPIGLVTMLAARAMGASKILITDILQSRLDFAKQLGADHTILVTKEASEDQLVQEVRRLLGDSPEVSIDASGAQATVRLALLATKSGGVAVLVGMGSPELTVPLAGSVAREVDIRGIFRYVNEYPIALSMVASGQINVKPLVSHHYSLEETLEAYEVARKGLGIKVMIHVQPRDANNPQS
ncbi:PREDICTED: sorbitol dehydrogenase-like [Papilio xuthus]|uniref:Sorbitol dehydrogenase n=1 Tax=Papilio xuthus TaxID=66420 RepID=A0A194PUJ4_PAPXU|nr:PREDICTED: sorbitol dehydrogenase-like [Papilio xuthus]KPI97076.1 Sorbitol dehydrogenase [Papilio xuthus]